MEWKQRLEPGISEEEIGFQEHRFHEEINSVD